MASQHENDIGESADGGHLQPEAAEVESARLLANEARADLTGDGMSEDDIRRAADAFVASGHAGDVREFIAEVREQWDGRPSTPPS